jgi:sugar lactone lactonase YvrE/polygalacturonase
MTSLVLATGLIVMVVWVQPTSGASFYTLRPDDPKAVYLAAPEFKVAGDGVADDSDALQAAVDKVQEAARRGIVFIPEGRYRLGKTVNVWSGIRLIGYGAQRPVLVLGEKTPGFQEGDAQYMLHFVSDRPQEGRPLRDANPGTFYSAMSNVDIEIKDGNPAAVGIRSHWAQHCYLAHIDFRIGQGRAGVQQVGNEIDDCRFFGGDFGLTTTKPSPSWPYLAIDCRFEGQRKAAIDTEEGGMTLVRCTFKNVPTAVNVHEDRHEELWMKDCRLEGISGPAVLITHGTSALMQANMQNVVCAGVPVLAQFRETGKKIEGPGPIYVVKEFCHGNQIADIGATPEIRTTLDAEKVAEAPAAVKTDIPALPSQDTWVNIGKLGAKGDGVADDTEVFKKAIAEHKAIYLPTGRYKITQPLVLKADTVLIGLNPITTQLDVPDFTAPFQGEGDPLPVVEAPKGGTNIMTGIGIDAGVNSRAVGLKWMAGKDSLVNDVRFLGGHGTYKADGSGVPVYNSTRTGDPDPKKVWGSQPWSLWITDGGGGTFKDIWTPDTFAKAGIYVSDTQTEGRLYAVSIEHHTKNEVMLKNVSNWKIYAIQMEEERGEGPKTLPLDIDSCSNITIVNVYLYRVNSPGPFPYGVKVTGSKDLNFRGMHCYGPGKLNHDNTLFDETHNVLVRTREIAWLKLSGNPPQAKAKEPKESPVLAAGAKLQKAVGGYENIDSMITDAAGNLYFIDTPTQKVYRWSADKGPTLLWDLPTRPQALAIDKAGNLMVIARAAPPTPPAGGTTGGFRGYGPPIPAVHVIKSDAKATESTILKEVPAEPRPGLTAILPQTRWRDAHDFLTVCAAPAKMQVLSPDGTMFIPISEDLLRAYALAPAAPGKPFYVADEFGQRVVAFTTEPDGALTKPKVLCEEGEAGVAVDEKGNVYVCAGQVFVYDPAGKLIDVIEVPERPSGLVFGGKDRQTLYIAARSSLYEVRTKFKGQ